MAMLSDGTLLVIELDKSQKEDKEEEQGNGEKYQLTQYDTRGNQIFTRQLADVPPFFMMEMTMQEKRCLALSYP